MFTKSSLPFFAALSLVLSADLASSSSILALAKSPNTQLEQTSPSRGESLVALKFKVPNVRGSGNREGGAARGSCSSEPNSRATEEKKITGLLPNTNLGLTVSPSPTLFVFVPKTLAPVAELAVYAENDNNHPVYEARFPVANTPGILKFAVPTKGNQSVLEVGKKYHWTLSVVCDFDDRAGDLVVDGWIQRVQPTASMETELRNASERDRPGIYAQEGIWYQTLASLADLRQKNPTDIALITEWKDLLNTVGLEKLADEPLVSCCTAEQRSASTGE